MMEVRVMMATMMMPRRANNTSDTTHDSSGYPSHNAADRRANRPSRASSLRSASFTTANNTLR
ncbi:hypothetical protein SAMN05444581_1434 [Methylocapsa palsarum]|uniref:Uncharacterized protein n=2 Tax=Methylocapsa palsarum TaxID=1612308 RepID=A0A1I4DB40_9HYPH|nr:hypothetical protein SAMN05444581_1434 [Methylocapsa palsarum]